MDAMRGWPYHALKCFQSIILFVHIFSEAIEFIIELSGHTIYPRVQLA